MYYVHYYLSSSLQQCAPPICPHGSIYDKRRCTCITTKTRPSTCPRGFKPIIRNRRCICVRITKPFCKGGTYLDKNCRCTIKVPPSCPSGTTISPRQALCTGSTEAMCRRGANRVPKRCACVEYRSRICPRGTKLSRNGCRCVSTVRTTPRCPNRGCFLNSKTCTCRPRIGNQYCNKPPQVLFIRYSTSNSHCFCLSSLLP